MNLRPYLIHFKIIYLRLIYSRPALYKNLQVPDVLLSGDTKKIDEWKEDHY